MDVRVFRPLSESPLEEGQLGSIKPAAVSYTENLYEPGSWSLQMSGYESYAETLGQGNLILFREGPLALWGIVRGVRNERSGMGAPISRGGDDLKGYLKQRICLYSAGSDLEGYDTVTGSTETVMKHYVKNNAVSPANVLRKMEGLTIAPDEGRGLADDRYMARFNPLADVLQEVGAAQEIGWKVDIELDTGLMVMDVIEGIDRTAGQSERPRIILDVNLRTAKSSSFVSDTENYRNAFYTTKDGARSEAEATTLLFFREDESEPAGINRYETQISVNVDSAAADVLGEMRNLARKESTNFDRDDTFTLELNGSFVYGKDFFLGDFVTIQDRFMGQREDVQLISVAHEWNGLGYRLTGSFGKPRKTNLQILERQIRTGGK